VIDIEHWTKRALQVAALVLGAKAGRLQLLEFYISRGADEESAQALIAAQARKVRLVLIPIAVVLMLLGMYVRSLVSAPGLKVVLSIVTYFGLFLLGCQMAASRSPSSTWKPMSEMMSDVLKKRK
jgi:hypothetical protein